MALTKVTNPTDTGSEAMRGTLISDLTATVETIERLNKLQALPLVEARKNLICLDEDAELFAEPSPALLEAEAKFWEGR